MIFSGWENLFHVLVVGTLAYTGLVFFLRLSGKRTLASMNAFDFIVSVAFGSTLASTMLPSKPALTDGLLALGLLVLLQYIVAWFEIRFPSFHRVVTSRPAMVFFRGEFLKKQMKRERIEEGDVLAIIRNKGITDLERVEAVVLETDGSFSVLTRPEGPVARSSLGHMTPSDWQKPTSQ